MSGRLAKLNPFPRVRNHAENVGANAEQHAVRRARIGYWAGRGILYTLAGTGLFAVVARFQDGGFMGVGRGSVNDVKTAVNGAGSAEAANTPDLAAPTETTVVVTTPSTERATAVGSIACYGEPASIVVDGPDDTPFNRILSSNEGLSTLGQAQEIYESPVFADINGGGFDPTTLKPGDEYFVPTECIDAADGP